MFLSSSKYSTNNLLETTHKLLLQHIHSKKPATWTRTCQSVPVASSMAINTYRLKSITGGLGGGGSMSYPKWKPSSYTGGIPQEQRASRRRLEIRLSRNVPTSTVKADAAIYSETSLTIYQSTRRDMPGWSECSETFTKKKRRWIRKAWRWVKYLRQATGSTETSVNNQAVQRHIPDDNKHQ